MSGILLASNREHVESIATYLLTADSSKYPKLLEGIFINKLMILTSRLTRILWTFARYTNREMNIFENMTRNDLDFAYFLIHETALHVLNGKDLEDKNSVGGWSQREVNLFVKVQQDAEKI